MPLRVVVGILVLWVCGTGIGLYLLTRWVRSLRCGTYLQKLRESLLVVGFLSLVVGLCSVFLPCFNLYGTALCHGSRSLESPRVALTFDDGPNEPYTSQILDILKKENIPATFFLVGKNITRYPEVVRRMLREGYVVGNHTWDHRPLVFMGGTEVRAEIEEWERVMQDFGMPSLKLFRAPHGWKTPTVMMALREKGYQLVGWTRGVWDSDRPGVEVLRQRLTQGAHHGDIILLHDGADVRVGIDRSQTVSVLPQLIDYYRRLGFRFVTIRDFLE